MLLLVEQSFENGHCLKNKVNKSLIYDMTSEFNISFSVDYYRTTEKEWCHLRSTL